MRLSIQYEQKNSIIWRTTYIVHILLQQIVAQVGINPITKKQIDHLYKSSVTTAKSILIPLCDSVNPILPKRFETDHDVNYFLLLVVVMSLLFIYYYSLIQG